MVVTAQEILDQSANVVQVVPLTSTIGPFGSEVRIPADESNGLEADSVAQCQHIRSVSLDRVESVRGTLVDANQRGSRLGAFSSTISGWVSVANETP